ncbi:MAG: BON domain-containing protein [Gammaproteobacteria bacterium]
MIREIHALCYVLPSLMVLLVTLSGCAPIVAGGAATGAVVTNDRRTTGTVIEDQAIESKAYDFLGADGALAEQAHINVTSYNQRVLLTGEAPTEELRKRAVEYVSRIAKVRHVHDEIRIAGPSTATLRANDTLLTTKVKAKLVSIRDISALDVKVVTEGGVVYLMGLLDQATGDAVAEAVATVGGISKVVKLFEAPG